MVLVVYVYIMALLLYYVQDLNISSSIDILFYNVALCLYLDQIPLQSPSLPTTIDKMNLILY